MTMPNGFTQKEMLVMILEGQKEINKQIEDNKGKTIISEGIEANYQDIINYSVFALILLDE